MKIAIEKFWCVKYYKAQPYNMEHTLCVCVSSLIFSADILLIYLGGIFSTIISFIFPIGYSHTKWEFFNEYDSKSRNIIQSCGRISIGIEKNRIRFYLNDDIFSQFLFVYFTLDCHYFVKKY